MDDDDDASVAGIEGGKGEFSHSFSFNQDYGTQDVAVPGNLSPAAGFGENDFTGGEKLGKESEGEDGNEMMDFWAKSTDASRNDTEFGFGSPENADIHDRNDFLEEPVTESNMKDCFDFKSSFDEDDGNEERGFEKPQTKKVVKSKIKSEANYWDQEVAPKSRQISALMNRNLGFEEQSFENTEKISARGFEKQANVSDLFGATNSSKKDSASRLTPIPKSSNSRIKSPPLAVRSLGSIDEESDVVIPTPKTRARFLQEGKLEGRKMVSPFRKPNDINEARHPSERNQQGYERRAAEPEITKEYIKKDHLRESVVTEENEEVRRTIRDDPRSSRVRQSPMTAPKQISLMKAKDRSDGGAIGTLGEAESYKLSNQNQTKQKRSDKLQRTSQKSKAGEHDSERVAESNDVVQLINGRQVEVNEKLNLHKAFVDRSRKCSETIEKGLEAVMELGKEYKSNLNNSSSEAQNAMLKLLQDLADSFECSPN